MRRRQQEAADSLGVPETTPESAFITESSSEQVA
jgi:hypothetical protein